MPTPNPAKTRRLDTNQAALYIDVTPGTMRNWRSAGVGPKFVRVGRTGREIRYELPALQSFKRELEARKC